VIDPSSNAKIADIPLPAHPESFQLGAGGEIFVNLPSVHAVGVVDRSTGRRKASWPTRNLGGNYPMALDDTAKHVIVAFRDPARLAVFAMADGASVAVRETCGDSDDVFFDAKRKRVYVVCGAGFIDAFDAQDGGLSAPRAYPDRCRGAHRAVHFFARSSGDRRARFGQGSRPRFGSTAPRRERRPRSRTTRLARKS
jgi:hypothetical protein